LKAAPKGSSTPINKDKTMKTSIILTLAITGTLLACGSDLEPEDTSSNDTSSNDTNSDDTGSDDTGSDDTASELDSQAPASPGALNDLAAEAREAMTQSTQTTLIPSRAMKEPSSTSGHTPSWAQTV
jgi:hypothetical protein